MKSKAESGKASICLICLY